MPPRKQQKISPSTTTRTTGARSGSRGYRQAASNTSSAAVTTASSGNSARNAEDLSTIIESPQSLFHQIEELKLKIVEMDQKLQEKDQKIQEKDQKLQEKDQKLQEKDQKIGHLKRKEANHSFYSLLSIAENQLKLKSESSYSASGTHHLKATATEMQQLSLTKFDSKMMERVKQMPQVSQLLVKFVDQTYLDQPALKFKEYRYVTEADVAVIVSDAVNDAVVLYKHLVRSKPEIKIRMERSLFSCRFDILVVLHSDYPILAIEVKKPMLPGKLHNSTKILGQVFDYAQLLMACGVSRPYVVLSTFEESMLCWVNFSSDESIQQHDKVTVATSTNSEDKETQSPPSLVDLPQTTSNEKDVQYGREFFRTQLFKPHQLVQFLHTGLYKSINENGGNRNIKRIYQLVEGKQYYFERVLKTSSSDNKNYGWQSLTFTLGKAITSNKRNTSTDSIDFYIIGTLGYGSTSTVYQAIDSNGMLVAIKVYAKTDDDNGILMSTNSFKKTATDAVAKEIKNFQTLYSDILDKKVRTFQLFENMHCLIMPFFRPVQKNERAGLMAQIQSVFNGRFHNNSLMYASDDIRWRHVGSYICANKKEHTILYDLADLVAIDTEDKATIAMDHFKVLYERIGTEEVVQAVNSFVMTETKTG
jgi:hypothetical protein